MLKMIPTTLMSGARHYHALLGLPYKGRAIKDFVVFVAERPTTHLTRVQFWQHPAVGIFSYFQWCLLPRLYDIIDPTIKNKDDKIHN